MIVRITNGGQKRTEVISRPTPILYIFLILSSLANSGYSRSVISQSCTSSEDETAIGQCLRPWLDTWETLKEEETNRGDPDELLFPIFYYTREEVLALCDVYIEKLDTCLTERILSLCKANPLVQFVQNQVGYVCGPRAVQVLSQFDCIHSSIKSKPECRNFMHGLPIPGLSEGKKCDSMPEFYKCIENDLYEKCGTKGLAILVQGIDNFGCDITELESAYTSNEEIVGNNLEPIVAQEVHLTPEIIELAESTSVESDDAPSAPSSAGETDSVFSGDRIAAPAGLKKLTQLDVKNVEIKTAFEDTEKIAINEEEDTELIQLIISAEAESASEEEPDDLINVGAVREDESVELPNGDEQDFLGLGGGDSEEFDSSLLDNNLLDNEASFSKSKSTEESDEVDFAGLANQLLSNDLLEIPISLSFEYDEGDVDDSLSLDNTPPPPPPPPPFNPFPSTVVPTSLPELPEFFSGGFELNLGPQSSSSEASLESLPVIPASNNNDESKQVSAEEIQESSNESTSSSTEEIAAREGNAGGRDESEDQIRQLPPTASSGIAPEIEGECTVVFPLFEYDTSDLLGLCDVLQSTLDQCLDDDLLVKCSRHPIMHFVDSLLGFACGTHKTDFFLSFDCIREVTLETRQCIGHIQGQPRSGTITEERCEGVPKYVTCMNQALKEKCSRDSLKMFLRSIQHFGCDMKQIEDLSDDVRNALTSKLELEVTNGGNKNNGSIESLPSLPETVVPSVVKNDSAQNESGDAIVRAEEEEEEKEKEEEELPVLTNPKFSKTDSIKESLSKSVKTIRKLIDDGSAEIFLGDDSEEVLDKDVRIKKLTSDQRSSDEDPVTLFEKSDEQGKPTADNPYRVGAPPHGVPAPPLDNSHPIISSFCTPRIKGKVRDCLRPLFVNWLQYRKLHEDWNNVTYPLFMYEKMQILEMCDLYASSFLECDFPLFDVCLTDEIVRFANNHLGYICAPSHIVELLSNFDCMQNVIRSNECISWINGPSEPGNDLQRCDGMSSFYDCIQHDIEEQCGQAAVSEFVNLISQFGCDVNEPKKVIQFSRIRRLA